MTKSTSVRFADERGPNSVNSLCESFYHRVSDVFKESWGLLEFCEGIWFELKTFSTL